MFSKPPTIIVIDDDPSLRKALDRFFKSYDFQVEVYAAANEYLASDPTDEPGCLILDLQMPGLNGLELQQELRRREIEIPIVFLTGHGDIPRSVQAMKAGAVDFVTKPFDDRELLTIVEHAITSDLEPRRIRREQQEIRERLASLTKREREVFDLVVEGMLNKQIASRLGAAEKTIKVHRGRVMSKMQATSVAKLVQMAGLIKPRSKS